MQAPLAFYKLCREVYISVGYSQLETEECIFVRYGNNVNAGSETDNERRTLTALADMKEIPSSDRVYQDCPHEIAVVIILLYVDNTGIRCDGGRGLPDIECRQFVFALQCLLGQILHPTNSCKCARLR